jgi:hypothetical protein
MRHWSYTWAWKKINEASPSLSHNKCDSWPVIVRCRGDRPRDFSFISCRGASSWPTSSRLSWTFSSCPHNDHSNSWEPTRYFWITYQDTKIDQHCAGDNARCFALFPWTMTSLGRSFWSESDSLPWTHCSCTIAGVHDVSTRRRVTGLGKCFPTRWKQKPCQFS